MYRDSYIHLDVEVENLDLDVEHLCLDIENLSLDIELWICIGVYAFWCDLDIEICI